MQNVIQSSQGLTRSQRRRRNDIVMAALTVFEREGFDAARMSDVATEAEVAKGTLYLYFDSKEALLKGVVHDIVEPAISAVTMASDKPEGAALDILRLQIKTISDRLGTGHMKSVLRLMISEGTKFGDLRRYYYDHIVAPGMSAISKTLAYGESIGEFKPGTSTILPQVFAGPALMSAIWRILFDDYDSLNIAKLFESQFRLIEDGILKQR